MDTTTRNLRPTVGVLFAAILVTNCGFGGPVDADTARPQASSISVVSATQQAYAGKVRPMLVAVRSRRGNAVSGAFVVVRTNSGSGSVNPGSGTTDASGQFAFAWTLGATIGTQGLTIESELGTSQAISVGVAPPPVASIALSSTSSVLPAYETVQLTAVLRDADGVPLSNRVVNWTSANPSIASVSPSGHVTGQAVGVTLVTASSEGRTASASITVGPAAVGSVLVTPGSLSMIAGGVAQVTAELLDVRGGALTGRPVTWSTSNASVATVTQQGQITAVGAGTATITAGSEGRQGQAQVVVANAVATVTVTLGTATLQPGQGTQATATLRDGNGNILSGRAISWNTSNASVATVTQQGQVTAVGAGTATITAVSDGHQGQAQVVVANAVETVTVALGTATLQPGQGTQATSTLRDVNGNILTGRAISWSTSNASVATVTQQGQVTAVGAGTATITAVSEGRQGQAQVVVSNPVASVTVVLAAVTLQLGHSTQATATLRDGSGNVLAGRPVTWSSSNTSVAAVSPSGVVSGVAASSQPVTITAQSEGKNGSTQVMVTSSGNQLIYSDDFASGIANWSVQGSGSWTTVNGELIGDYNISCGGPTCSQTQLLLSDAYQPALNGITNWRMEAQAGLVQAHSFNGGAFVHLAKFTLFNSATVKDVIDAGASWGGGAAVPATYDEAYASHQRYPWTSIGYQQLNVPTWSTVKWQTVIMEKVGDTFTVYFKGDADPSPNGVRLYSFTRVFTSPLRVGFSTYGKVRMDNFKLYRLP